MSESGSHEEPECARTDDAHDVACCDRRSEYGMHCAGHRFDRDRVLVGELVGYGVELGRVRHEPGRRPTAACIGAEARLESGPDVPEGDVATVAHVAGLA